MASFQELYAAARRKAFAKPKAQKIIKPKPAKVKPIDDPAERARKVFKARKEKAAGAFSDDKQRVDYTLKSRASHREKPLPNRPLNLENKIKVQIDRKTWVYVDPDADIEAIKAKYARPTYDRFEDLPPRYQF